MSNMVLRDASASKNKQKNAKAKMVQEINCGSLGLLTNVAKPSCEIGPLRSDGHKNISILSDTIFECP